MDTSWRGHYFMTDFESALRQSLHAAFPYLFLIGCYFHWSQLIMKRVKNSKMNKYFQQTPQFSAFIRRVCSLPFVPDFCMSTAMILLQEYVSSLEGPMLAFGKRLLRYIDIQWVDNINQIQNWNLFEIDCNIIPTTNNGQESGNKRLNVQFPVHPSVYIFLIAVVRHLDILGMKMGDIKGGRIKNQAKKIYREIQEERERAKAVLIEKVNKDNVSSKNSKEHLNFYMGKMGVPAARIGREKVDSDYSVRDLTAEGEDPAWIAAGEDSGFELEISNNAGSRDRVKSKATKIVGEKRKRPKNLGVIEFMSLVEGFASSINVSEINGDILDDHIRKHKLSLQKFGHVRSQGDCFYDSLLNLCLHHCVTIPATNSLELRKAIINHIEKHPNFQEWLGVLWRGRMAVFRKFQAQHRVEQTITDNSGIIFYTAMDLLNVSISVVSPNPQNIPMTNYDGPSNSTTRFYLGYYQVNIYCLI